MFKLVKGLAFVLKRIKLFILEEEKLHNVVSLPKHYQKNLKFIIVPMEVFKNIIIKICFFNQTCANPGVAVQTQ